MNKYGNKKTWCDGILFDSQAEARRYRELKLMEQAGLIRDLELQPEFTLLDDFIYESKKVRGIKYRADFRYTDCTEERGIVEDVKGALTPDFKLKLKLFRAKMHVELRLVKA